MNRSTYTRRTLLRTVASAGVLGTAASLIRASPQAVPQPRLEQGALILFQGDSITDAGRNRDVHDANNSAGLGTGYAAIASGQIMLAHPTLGLKCLNRGISGNKIPDLSARWQQDAIDLKPALLSILIGVNDLWHTVAFGRKYKGTLKDYETGYRALIERSRDEIPGVRIVLCEPFTTRADVEFEALAGYGGVARVLAEEMQLPFVPFQSLFDEACKIAPAEFWLRDGIHPTLAGHAIMAGLWREVVGV